MILHPVAVAPDVHGRNAKLLFDAESHESSHRFSRKVATRSHQSSHPFGAAGFGATEGAVLPLGFSRLVRGGCDGTGKVGDEKGEEATCVSFRPWPQRPRDRDPLRSCAALGGADPGAVRRLRAELAGGPRSGRGGPGGGALSDIPGFGLAGGGLGEGRERPVRPRHDADAAVGGMARDASRRDELSDLVPPVPGIGGRGGT